MVKKTKNNVKAKAVLRVKPISEEYRTVRPYLAILDISIRATTQQLPDCRLTFHSRAPSSRIRLDANAIIDG
jgi:hypothetical protein